MKENNIKLTTSELGILWTIYTENTALRCFYMHFLHHLEDNEIKGIIEEALAMIETHIERVKSIFEGENIPIPVGFSDKDVDLTAPALYTDLFALSFLYRGGQVIVPFYATALTKVSRVDIVQFIIECLGNESKLYDKSLSLMLSKGLYDRPPKMEYPNSVEFVKHNPSLIETWIGERRPLNSLEIGEIFSVVERNAIGLILIMGLIQVTKDKEIKEYLLKGKRIAEKQIDTFTKLLNENDNFSGTPTTMEVTNSTISPFSERLILFFIGSTNQVGISTLGYALSITMRKDISAHYALFMTDIMKYGHDGLKLLIDRGWMERPPQPIDRNEFYKN
ncbi:DUF3231 family protein [Bacillus sp. FJAT-49736]|uniref:DUF3231 family protein n=1 Tax=Bacillus sp. FJAT-49736 TaxID=2833582 RepID=UPI001BC8F261|nr:DUF3231 family protein [Bacillus sp. FJAT-49736]MBS4172253.1 DUF3231 family protein [Bacillus sp. FJAT-49736]